MDVRIETRGHDCKVRGAGPPPESWLPGKDLTDFLQDDDKTDVEVQAYFDLQRYALQTVFDRIMGTGSASQRKSSSDEQVIGRFGKWAGRAPDSRNAGYLNQLTGGSYSSLGEDNIALLTQNGLISVGGNNVAGSGELGAFGLRPSGVAFGFYVQLQHMGQHVAESSQRNLNLDPFSAGMASVLPVSGIANSYLDMQISTQVHGVSAGKARAKFNNQAGRAALKAGGMIAAGLGTGGVATAGYMGIMAGNTLQDNGKFQLTSRGAVGSVLGDGFGQSLLVAGIGNSLAAYGQRQTGNEGAWQAFLGQDIETSIAGIGGVVQNGVSNHVSGGGGGFGERLLGGLIKPFTDLAAIGQQAVSGVMTLLSAAVDLVTSVITAPFAGLMALGQGAADLYSLGQWDAPGESSSSDGALYNLLLGMSGARPRKEGEGGSGSAPIPTEFLDAALGSDDPFLREQAAATLLGAEAAGFKLNNSGEIATFIAKMRQQDYAGKSYEQIYNETLNAVGRARDGSGGGTVAEALAIAARLGDTVASPDYGKVFVEFGQKRGEYDAAYVQRQAEVAAQRRAALERAQSGGYNFSVAGQGSAHVDAKGNIIRVEQAISSRPTANAWDRLGAYLDNIARDPHAEDVARFPAMVASLAYQGLDYGRGILAGFGIVPEKEHFGSYAHRRSHEELTAMLDIGSFLVPGGAAAQGGILAKAARMNRVRTSLGMRAVLEALNPARRFARVGVYGQRAATMGGAAKRAAGPRVLQNQAAGNAASDALAAVYSGARREVTFQTAFGARRVDVYVLQEALSLESKVGRTSLSREVRRQLAKDIKLLRDPTSGIDTVRWVFQRSGATGKIGPTKPLIDTFQKFRRHGYDIDFLVR